MNRTLLAGLVCIIVSLAACAPPAAPAATATPSAPPVPASTPQPLGDFSITFKRTGGIAGVNQTYIIKPDGSVDMGTGPKQADGGADAAAKLASEISATGIYAVASGTFMPANPCCDRFTYDITIVQGGKTFNYTTMDGTENAPAALMQTVGLLSKYVATAK